MFIIKYKFIICALLISCIKANTDLKIKDINQEIDKIVYKVLSFEFDYSIKEIDLLIKQCRKNDYLIGEIELLDAKTKTAIAMGQDDLIYKWQDDYQDKLKQAIGYGITAKEIYYKLLYLSTQITIEGFDYHRDDLEDLQKRAQRNQDFATEAIILYSLYKNLSGNEKDEIIKQLDKIFLDNIILKESFTYVAYLNDKTLDIINRTEVDGNVQPLASTADESAINIVKAEKLSSEKKYEDAIALLIESNEKYPKNFEILTYLSVNYLYLNIEDNNKDYLESALNYLKEAIVLHPNGENINYNLSCVYSQLNDIDNSLKYLERSLSLGNTNYSWILEDPDLENLRKNINIETILDKYDKWTISHNNFNEIENYSNRLNFNNTVILTQYRKFVSYMFSYKYNQLDTDYDNMLKLLSRTKNNNIDYYLSEILSIPGFLNEYIETQEDLFTKRKKYIENIVISDFNNEIESYDKFKASYLARPYGDLAEINLEQSDLESYFKNMERSIQLEEIIDESDYLLIYKYVSLAKTYSDEEYVVVEEKKSYSKYSADIKKNIKKAERLLKNLSATNEIIKATILITDFHLNHSLENHDIIFKKTFKPIKNALELAEGIEDPQLIYDCILRLQYTYELINNGEMQYKYCIKADSLLVLYNLIEDGYMYYRECLDVFTDYKEVEKIRRMCSSYYEYHYAFEQYESAFDLGVENLWLNLYKVTAENIDYFTLKDWIKRLDSIEKNQYWNMRIKLLEWQIEIAYNQANDQSSNSFKLIPQLKSKKNNIIELDNEELTTQYVWLSKRLLIILYESGNYNEYQKLFNFIEPLQWKDAGLFSDNWFLQFVDGSRGPYNEELYNKYINRILSYPLDIDRLREKRIHAIRLLNWGKFDESVRILEDALVEAKQISTIEEELIILIELAKAYDNNFQYSLSKRRFLEAKILAKDLEDDLSQEVILVSLLDGVLEVSDPEFPEVLSEYFELSKKVSSYFKFNMQIQTIFWKLAYFQYIHEPDSIIQYVLEGISIKDSVEHYLSDLRYLTFLQQCFNLINNDQLNMIGEPITAWVFDNKKIEDPRLQKLYEEIVYLKNYDLSTIDQELINEYPFYYVLVQEASIKLKEYWDNDYLQSQDLKKMIKFWLTIQKEQDKNYGRINALLTIEDRIKTIEEWSAEKLYFGFGFSYEINNNKEGLEITYALLKSPAYDLINQNDIILIENKDEITRESAEDFIKAKVNEADVLLNKPARLTVLRNSDTLTIEIMPGEVQPNLYSEAPKEEVSYLVKKFFDISDSLLQETKNIVINTDFLYIYIDFLINYPNRYSYLNNEYPSSEILIEFLNRYENIATHNLVNESIEHKMYLDNNPLLLDEYKIYSNRINQIQLELQDSGLNNNKLESLQRARDIAYKELKYYEEFNLQKTSDIVSSHVFSFQDNINYFNMFDYVVRYFLGPTYSITLLWNKKENQFYIDKTSSDDEISVSLKYFTQLLSFSAVDTSYNEKMINSLVKLANQINYSSSIPIWPDNAKKKTDILVIPEGSLNFLPFELMPIRFESDTTQLYSYVDYFNITYAPSLSSYIQFARKKSKTKNTKSALLVSANPNTESTTKYVDNLLAMRSEYGNIEFVDNEISNIDEILSKKKIFRRKFKTNTFKSTEITEAKFKSSKLEKYKYIHIAAHGVHDDENPNYSGILLGRETNDGQDGILQAHEIYPLKLNADLVTLSSCFSGFGEIDPNEGNLGIYRSFLIAGAKSVIISLWNVEDESTSLLFTKLYEYLKEGKTKSESLRLAKLYLKNETRFRSPYFWAPFILLGES